MDGIEVAPPAVVYMAGADGNAVGGVADILPPADDGGYNELDAVRLLG